MKDGEDTRGFDFSSAVIVIFAGCAAAALLLVVKTAFFSPRPVVMEIDARRWQSFGNSLEKYSLKLPREFVKTESERKATFVTGSDPYEYTVMSLKRSPDPFQLVVGTYLNTAALSPFEYLKRRDTTQSNGVGKSETLSIEVISVDGIQAVQSEALVKLGGGRLQRWSRVVIPYGDKLFLISGLIGREQAVLQFKAVFDAIVQTFAIEKPG